MNPNSAPPSAGRVPGPASGGAAAPWRRDLLGLALFFGVLFAFRIGAHPLGNPDEGRYGEIPREMVASGDWVTPGWTGLPISKSLRSSTGRWRRA